VGASFKVSGYVRYNGERLSGVPVSIYVDGSYTSGATTDSNGYYSRNIYISTIGQHTLRASALGVYAERVITITYTPAPSSISVYAPSGVYTGDPFTIYGYVKDQYGNPYYSGPVTVTVAGQTHTTYGNSSTGYYSVGASISTAGTYTIRASAGSVSASRSIQVVAPEPTPPYVNSVTISAPGSAAAGQSFTIQGTVKDQYGDGMSGVAVSLYRDGTSLGTATTGSGGSYSKQASIAAAGTYTLKAVADSKQATRSITVTAALDATLVASPTSGAAPLAVTFTMGAGGGALPYTWSLDPGDGSAPYTGSRTTEGSWAKAHTYARAGTFTATLTVTDAAGAAAADRRTVAWPGAEAQPTGAGSLAAAAAPIIAGAALLATARKP